MPFVRVDVYHTYVAKLNKRYDRYNSTIGLKHRASFFEQQFPEEFPEWHASPTAALFTPPVFENKKENKGYWF